MMNAPILASGFQTGAVLSLVLPAVVLVAIGIWFFVLWRRGMGER
jgi:hypothetical protein